MEASNGHPHCGKGTRQPAVTPNRKKGSEKMKRFTRFLLNVAEHGTILSLCRILLPHGTVSGNIRGKATDL